MPGTRTDEEVPLGENPDRASGLGGAGRQPWAVLSIVNGPDDGTEVPLWVEPEPLGGTVTLGRDDGADVRIRHDPAVEGGATLVLGPADFELVTGGADAGGSLRKRVAYGTPCRVGNTWLVVRKCARGLRPLGRGL